jgi:hypothetical protein
LRQTDIGISAQRFVEELHNFYLLIYFELRRLNSHKRGCAKDSRPPFRKSRRRDIRGETLLRARIQDILRAYKFSGFLISPNS